MLGMSSAAKSRAVALVALPQFSTQTLIMCAFLCALVLTALVWYAVRSKVKKRGNIVLLLGIEGAGKTAILSTMAYDRALPTHTSLSVNSVRLEAGGIGSKRRSGPGGSGKLVLVDIPGHPRLRGTFRTHVASAKAVVFVVDASTITRNAKDVAEYMHHVLHALTSLPASRTLPPLLILAHKADLFASPTSTFLPPSSTPPSAAASPSADREGDHEKDHDRVGLLAISRVRSVLERELERRRVAAASGTAVGIGGVGGAGTGVGANEAEAESSALEDLGGLESRSDSGAGVFRFAGWEGGPVEFAATWIRVGSDGADPSSTEKSEDGMARDGLDELRLWLDGLP